MKSIYGSLAAAALSLWFLPAAHAQTYGVGTCTGSTDMLVPLMGSTQLSVAGTLIPTTSAAAVFNQAECQCQSRDIDMHFILTTGTGLGVSAPVAEMWVGAADCNDPNGRAIKMCDEVTASNPPNNTAWMLNGASFQKIGYFDVPIPPEVVTNPKPTGGYMCQTGGMANSTVTVTIGPPATPASCTMPLAVNTQGPIAPQGVTVTTGDSGLALDWNVPVGTGGIENYQVLCRKQSAPTQPAMSADFLNNNRYYFSSCINNHLYRRLIGALMMQNDPATTTDIPISGGTFPIDPRLRCSDRIPASDVNLKTRLTGLTNGQTYDIMVVSIDSYGNASASAVVTGTPQATAGPLDGYCDGAACPGFGCQAGRGRPATGGAGTATAGLVAVAMLWLARRARRVA